MYRTVIGRGTGNPRTGVWLSREDFEANRERPLSADEQKAGRRKPEKEHATPSARKLSKEKGLDVRQIRGTGTDGKVTTQDVKDATVD